MDKIGNVDSIVDSFVWKDGAGLVTKELGRFSGSKKLYANVDSVPPGCYSAKYHSHTQQEEFFFILSGQGILRFDGAEYPVKAGNFVSKPAGKHIAHTFYNSGTLPLEILDVGTVEPEDTCYYPDEDMYLYKSNGTAHALHGSALTDDWSSDPNE